MIRVALADDQALVRAGFRVLLDAEDDVEVVAEAADGAEAVEMVRATKPDVVLMDIRMPEVDGLEATRRIVADESNASVRVLILTTSSSTSTCSRRCGRERAASLSRTPSRRSSFARCASSPAGRHCSLPE